jgi:hypothetical protein
MDCDSSKGEFGLLAIVAVAGFAALRVNGDNIGPNQSDFHDLAPIREPVTKLGQYPKPRPVAEPEGLVYGVTPLPKEEPVAFYKNEFTWAILVVVIFAVLNILFW